MWRRIRGGCIYPVKNWNNPGFERDCGGGGLRQVGDYYVCQHHWRFFAELFERDLERRAEYRAGWAARTQAEAERKRMERERKTQTYFAVLDDYVKIGKSVDPEKRVLQIRTSCDYPPDLRKVDPELVLVLPGNREYRLHQRFIRSRVGRTEWFHLTDDIKKFIEENAA